MKIHRNHALTRTAIKTAFTAAIGLAFYFIALPTIVGIAQTTTEAVNPTQGSVKIVGGQYFDTTAGVFVKNEGLLIEDGKFKSLSDDSAQVQSITLEDDAFILPGLIDCHAHYNVRLIRKRREEFTVIPIQYLANGVTVTFSCGEYNPEGMLKLKHDIASGKKIGPRLLNSGPYFGTARRPWHADPDKVREEVDFWAEKGVGGFKAKLIDPPSLKALIEQAHKHDLTVTGHLDSGFRNSVNPSTAIDLGIDRIEHFLGGDAMGNDQPAYSTLGQITADMPEFKAIVQKFIETETVFDATISAYGYFGTREKFYDYWYDERQLFTPHVQALVTEREKSYRPMMRFHKIFETKQTTIDDYFAAGGKISLGTDHFSNGTYLAGFGAHREMEILNSAGIPAADVLRIATINGAEALNIDQQHGSIAVGKSGDLVIVTGNPLDDIKNTRNVQTVVRAGVVYDSAELLDSVKGKLGPATAEEEKDW